MGFVCAAHMHNGRPMFKKPDSMHLRRISVRKNNLSCPTMHFTLQIAINKIASSTLRMVYE